MLNSVGATARVRMTPEDRRRQLVGIGLRKFVERPVQELSLDEVAAEAGVSRGLLFHYFPTKTDYHRAVVEAARRRVGRNVSARCRGGRRGRPCARSSSASSTRWPGGARPTSPSSSARRRSREPPATTASPDGPRARGRAGRRATGMPDAALPVAHGWVAYLEDRALQWSALPEAERDAGRAGLVDHCTHALTALATRA